MNDNDSPLMPQRWYCVSPNNQNTEGNQQSVAFLQEAADLSKGMLEYYGLSKNTLAVLLFPTAVEYYKKKYPGISFEILESWKSAPSVPGPAPFPA